MHIIITLVLGAFIGWAASRFMGADAQMGGLANIIVGILGAGIGHWLAGAAGLATGNPAVRIIVGILGACILIWLLRMLNVGL